MRTPSARKSRRTAPSEAPTARITPISRARSTTLMLIVPVRPRPPTTPSRSAIDREEDDQDVEEALLRGPDLARSSSSRRRGRRPSRGGRRRPCRPGPGSAWSGASVRSSDHRRAPDLAGRLLERPGVRVQERPLGRRLDDPDERPGRIPAVDPQRDRVADPEVGLVVADVRGRHERVAVARGGASGPPGASADHRGVGREPEGDERAALRAVVPDPLGRREAPRLGGGHARHAGSLRLQHVRAGRPRELDLDVVVEVGEGVVERLVER